LKDPIQISDRAYEQDGFQEHTHTKLRFFEGEVLQARRNGYISMSSKNTAETKKRKLWYAEDNACTENP